MTRHPGAAQLERFAAGELDADRAAELAAHVAGCASCAARVAAERELDELVLRSAPVVDTRAADRALERLWRAVDEGALGEAPAVGEVSADGEPAHASREVPRAATLHALERDASREVVRPRDAAREAPASASPRDTSRTPRAAALLVAAAALLALIPWLLSREHAGSDGASQVPDAPLAHDTRSAPHAPPSVDLAPHTEVAPDAAPPLEELAAHDAAPRPDTQPVAPPLDLERLEATRARVVAALLEAPVDRDAAPGAPEHPAAAAEHVSAALAPLRAEGWPVDVHLRGLVLGADTALAERALEHVLVTGGAPSLLAQALRAGVGGDALLERLPRGELALDDSPALVAALAERAPRDARARALLLAEPNPRTRRALDALLTAALDAALVREQRADSAQPPTLVAQADSDPRAGAAPEPAPPADFATLCAELPHADALPWLVRAARPGDDAPALAAWARARFLARAADAQLPAAASLRPLLADAPHDDPRLDWAVDARLDALVPDLAQRLDAREHAHAARARLARFATPDAAFALFVELAEDLRGRADASVLRGLLHDHPELAEPLGARAAAAHGAALVSFAESLDAEPAEQLLLGALFALPEGRDPRGRRAELLGTLARVGGERAGRALLARVDALPADDAVLALAWATAARLAGDAAGERWLRQGGDPHTLAQVAADVGERFDREVRPPARLLRPLERELPRVAASR